MSGPRGALLCAAVVALLPSTGACQSGATPSALSQSAVRTLPSPSAVPTLPSPSATTTSLTPSADPTTKPASRPRTTQMSARARIPATPSPPRARPAGARAAAPKPAPARPKPAPSFCAVPAGLTSRQVVLVDAHGSGATIRACERAGSRYRQVLGPYAGHVGANGVSSTKREGDLRTPVGVFPLRSGFGIKANPGLGAGSWLRVDSRDVWVDDPGSALYNTHRRLPAGGRWNSAERLQQAPAYNYAQVIGYNEARRPGAGSAIFMHVDQGRATAGCVSLPTPALLSVMRWERPGVVISITP